MKTTISEIIIALGFYIILLSSTSLWTISANQEEIARGNVYMLDYLKQKHLKGKPNCDFNKEICVIEFSTEMKIKSRNYLIVMSVGVLMFISGIILIYMSRKNKLLKFKSKKNLILFRLAEVTLNLIYWILIGLLYFTLQIIIKKEVSSCVTQSMFIFYASGLTGFYAAYFYLTDKYLKNKNTLMWFVGCFLTIILGFVLAYVVPDFKMIISTPNSLSNQAFFNGFLYLAFFVVANIVVGTVFKGFFNWIKIVYSLQTETPNDL